MTSILDTIIDTLNTITNKIINIILITTDTTLKIINKIISIFKKDDKMALSSTIAHVKDDYEYHKQVELTGSAQNIDLQLVTPIQLNRIEVYTDDTTAKSYTVDVYSGIVTPDSYVRLASFTGDTEQSNFVQGGGEYRFLQPPINIRIAITSSTTGKIMTVKIIVEKLKREQQSHSTEKED